MRKNHWEWSGPDDNSFRFGTAYDDEFVYIGIKAMDEDVFVYPNKMPFLQDCVWIAIEARAEPYRSNSRVQEYFSKIALFYLSPGTAETPTRLLKSDELPEGSKAASVIVPGGHITEIALPTAYIEQRQGKPWQAFRLSIAVCDIDGEEDRGSQICGSRSGGQRKTLSVRAHLCGNDCREEQRPCNELPSSCSSRRAGRRPPLQAAHGIPPLLFGRDEKEIGL